MSDHFTFNVRIEMLSDWGVGSGAGRQGSIDRLIERDVDDLPYVPAKTLRGMWRDSAEQLAFGLDNGGSGGSWTALLPHLFGSQPAIGQRGGDRGEPIPARLSVSDANFGQAERAFLGHPRSRSLRDALAFVKPGVAIDLRSGQAETDSLRFDEMARKGIVLSAEGAITLAGDEAANKALIALALASLKLLDRLGGKRRRGAGQCVVNVEVEKPRPGLPASVNAAIEMLGKAAAKVDYEGPNTSTVPASARSSQASDWVKFDLDIALLAPLLIADEVQGNVVTTRDHIPGTMLLPVMARALDNANLSADLIRAGFACGDIRVLPAYPIIDGERTWPTPLVWARKKDDSGGPDGEGEITNFLVDEAQHGPIRSGYLVLGENSIPRFAETSKIVRTHNAVDDDRQKPTTEAGGGVYSYEMLKTGGRFRSELWIRTAIAEVLNIPKETWRLSASIGRSRATGYGQVSITIERREPGTPQPPLEAKEGVIFLYFASDTVIRLGRPAVRQNILPLSPLKALSADLHNALLAALRESCGVEDAAIEKAELRLRRHEGWIVGWGLPRPTRMAIAAGSAAKIRISPSDRRLAQRLQNLAENGLGEFRGEGFGHVLIDHAIVKDCPNNNTPQKKKNPEGGERRPLGLVSDAFVRLLDTLEYEAAKEVIQVRAELAVSDHTAREKLFGWSKTDPSMSQLGALRAVIGDLSTQQQLDAGIAYLTARAESGGWHGKSLKLFDGTDTAWLQLKRHSGAQETDWGLFGFARSDQNLEADPNLKRYAIACLFHSAMRAHKRMIEKPNRQTAGVAAATAEED